MERFTDKQIKFKYHTYTVESNNKEVDKAISQNGNIKIEFYNKKKIYRSVIDNRPYIYYSSTTGDIGSITASCTSNYDVANTSACYTGYDPSLACSSNTLSLNDTKETGRVGEGSYSDQKFKNIYMEFEY